MIRVTRVDMTYANTRGWLGSPRAVVIIGAILTGCSRQQPLLVPTGFYDETVVAVACGAINETSDYCGTQVGSEGAIVLLRWQSPREDGAVFYVQRYWYHEDEERLAALTDSIVAAHRKAVDSPCSQTVGGQVVVWEWQTPHYRARLFAGNGVSEVHEFRGGRRPGSARGWSLGPVLELRAPDVPELPFPFRVPC